MPTKKQKVEVFREDYICDCGGELIATGYYRPTISDSIYYSHKCNHCARICEMSSKYPIITYEPIEPPTTEAADDTKHCQNCGKIIFHDGWCSWSCLKKSDDVAKQPEPVLSDDEFNEICNRHNLWGKWDKRKLIMESAIKFDRSKFRETELRCCPKCKAPAVMDYYVVEGKPEHFAKCVECVECGACGSSSKSIGGAISNWNRCGDKV